VTSTLADLAGIGRHRLQDLDLHPRAVKAVVDRIVRPAEARQLPVAAFNSAP